MCGIWKEYACVQGKGAEEIDESKLCELESVESEASVVYIHQTEGKKARIEYKCRENAYAYAGGAACIYTRVYIQRRDSEKLETEPVEPGSK